MGYRVSIYRREVKSKQLAYEGEDFFENTDNLLPFTSDQKETLEKRLLNYGYLLQNENATGKQFEHKKLKGVLALLTDHALYFESGFTEQGVFEISMTASEFTDTDEFVKYDPQNEGWEEF
ncbi:hypothetical protein QNI19_21395 [Cytophagaceae bacterium DM2B3-1]|uniref:Uncharacterized protein n=2 Tax=Xanthocytophaga TaxID=3078918 RepID=A0ABT7CP38_9BACT|nr:MULTISPECIES: hypothetical protein [Xanthocytophaga]MDJ1495509.1 hypothetical protein [Xanthocytophaga flavus]MDJ1500423.1 hypothetical protein [Xanthocytophaga agilis]